MHRVRTLAAHIAVNHDALAVLVAHALLPPGLRIKGHRQRTGVELLGAEAGRAWELYAGDIHEGIPPAAPLLTAILAPVGRHTPREATNVGKKDPIHERSGQGSKYLKRSGCGFSLSGCRRSRGFLARLIPSVLHARGSKYVRVATL